MSLRALAESIDRKEILLPILQKFLKDEKAAIESGKKTRKDVEIEEANLTIKAEEERKREFNHGEEVGRYFHPSALGVCLRRLAFGVFQAPVNDAKGGNEFLREYMVFAIGTAVHIAFQNLCDRAGVLKRREAAIESKKLELLGHADGILSINDLAYVLEIKSINTRGMTMLRAPKPEHVKQVHAYMRVLKIDCAIVVYIDKDRSSFKEYVVPFDRAYYMKEVRKRKNKAFRCIDNRKLPLAEGDSPHRFPCSFCEFSRICYDSMGLAAWAKKAKVTILKKKSYDRRNSKKGSLYA